jgi:ariadne-1
MLQEVIEEVKELLCLSSRSQAAKILRCYHWNKEKLLSDFFSGATASCILDGGEYEEEDALGTEWTIDKPGTFECGICMEDVPYRSSHALSCGHRYCEDCWVGYMTVRFLQKEPLNLTDSHQRRGPKLCSNAMPFPGLYKDRETVPRERSCT